MKYSIVMPYYSRPELRFALDSFRHHYNNRDDYEIIIVEDSKNNKSEKMHGELLSIVDRFKGVIKINPLLDSVESYNSCIKYNLGVRESTGSIIVLTNPETPHKINILNEFDKIDFTNNYIVCACSSMHLKEDKGTFLDSTFVFYKWYQHTTHRNAYYHFCSAISRENYNKCGGFDERYSMGLAFEDNNFVRRIRKSGLAMVARDDLVTYHIEHPRTYFLDNVKYKQLYNTNQSLWYEQTKTGKF